MREGHLGMTLLLLTNGADVNIVSPCSATPLHVATIYRRTDIAKVLKEHGSGCQGGRRCACMPQGVPIPWNHAVKSTKYRTDGMCPNESDVLKMSNRFSELVFIIKVSYCLPSISNFLLSYYFLFIWFKGKHSSKVICIYAKYVFLIRPPETLEWQRTKPNRFHMIFWLK